MPSYGYDSVAGTWTAAPELPPTSSFDAQAKGLPIAWWYLNLTLPVGAVDQQFLIIQGEPNTVTPRNYTNTNATTLQARTGDMLVWAAGSNIWQLLVRSTPTNLPAAASKGFTIAWYFLNLTLPTGIYADQMLVIIGEGSVGSDRVYTQPSGGTVTLRNGDHCVWVVGTSTWSLQLRLK